MHGNRSKIVVAVAVIAVLVGAVAGGRHLLGGTPGVSAGPASSRASAAMAPTPATTGANTAAPVHASSGAVTASGLAATKGALTAPGGSGTGDQISGSTSTPPAVPTFAVTPQVVHTASLEMRVGKGKLDAVLRTVTALAGADGGYVDSSSVSGGTARRSPVAGTIVFRVLDSDFADAITSVANLGTVEDQKITGKDVTIQVNRNAASMVVLEDEVTLLQKQLAEATNLASLLQIEGQLFPVEQELQQLQASQAVLQNSAALATVTVALSAPGAPVTVTPRPGPNADAAATAWRYLRHNSLAVLDGLAVAGGWALPVIVLLTLVAMIALWVVRRRRHVVHPA
jgi:hypothetical protein